MAAGYRFPADRHLRVGYDLESHLAAKSRQHGHIASRFVAEMEVVSLVYFDRLQSLFQDAMCELMRGHQRQVAGERQQQCRIDPRLLQESKLLRCWSQQLEGTVRAQDADRMWLERHCDSLGVRLARPFQHRF